jgi:ADP-heptose:LPS heptosyltransferase
MKTVLLVRMDKIGDLCVTLPVDWVFYDANVVWFVSQGTEFVIENSLPKRNFFSFSKSFSWANFKQFVLTVRRLKPDCVVVFHAPAWVSLAVWVSRVPVRVGVWSKFWSFLFFNKGVRQKRSRSDRHELSYNLDLIHKGLKVVRYTFESLPKLTLRSLQSNVLGSYELKSKSYIVVHPGMAGSALNWSPQKYIELISQIPKSQIIVVTGTQMDRPWTLPLQEALKKNSIVWLQEKLKVTELLVLLDHAKVVLAPSTGVIHLAAALNTPVIGIYSPRQVERPTRWGPLGHHVKVFVPNVSGQITEDVMNFIKVQDVYNELEKHF